MIFRSYLILMLTLSLGSGSARANDDDFFDRLKCDPATVREIMKFHAQIKASAQVRKREEDLNGEHSLAYYLSQTSNRNPLLGRAVYVRDYRGLATANQTYIENMQRAQQMFSQWFEKWMKGEQTVDQAAWIQFMKERHLTATGETTGTQFIDMHGDYHTSAIDPGKMRNEVPGNSAPSQLFPNLDRHINEWLSLNSYPVREEMNHVVQVNGMDDLLKEKKRQLKGLSYSSRGTRDLVNYAHPEDVDLYLDLTWQRLKEIKEGIEKVNLNRGKIPDLELTWMRLETLDHIADYYQATLVGHFFVKVNNSVLMTEVNTWLQMMDLTPVFHGHLDLVAIRMDYVPFRQYFKDFVMRTD